MGKGTTQSYVGISAYEVSPFRHFLSLFHLCFGFSFWKVTEGAFLCKTRNDRWIVLFLSEETPWTTRSREASGRILISLLLWRALWSHTPCTGLLGGSRSNSCCKTLQQKRFIRVCHHERNVIKSSGWEGQGDRATGEEPLDMAQTWPNMAQSLSVQRHPLPTRRLKLHLAGEVRAYGLVF